MDLQREILSSFFHKSFLLEHFFSNLMMAKKVLKLMLLIKYSANFSNAMRIANRCPISFINYGKIILIIKNHHRNNLCGKFLTRIE